MPKQRKGEQGEKKVTVRNSRFGRVRDVLVDGEKVGTTEVLPFRKNDHYTYLFSKTGATTRVSFQTMKKLKEFVRELFQ